MSDGSSLFNLAAELLAGAVTILDWKGRHYVSIGEPAYDCCPQMTVFTQRLEDAAAGPTAPQSVEGAMRIGKRSGRRIWATMQIDVVGCVPTGTLSKSNVWSPPSADALHVKAAEIYEWGWMLRCGLAQMKRDGDLFNPAVCRETDLGLAVPITPEGGCAGWRVPVLVQLDGYDPV